MVESITLTFDIQEVLKDEHAFENTFNVFPGYLVAPDSDIELEEEFMDELALRLEGQIDTSLHVLHSNAVAKNKYLYCCLPAHKFSRELIETTLSYYVSSDKDSDTHVKEGSLFAVNVSKYFNEITQ